ncbi:hypothetical protein [Hungatella effluvii]|uniref:hypothetical protein n=1 Tax=Hungatella effluvii TaxID=1096246 RepID=UPI0022E57DFB|nr:hypothetical protein [Hungatella effluvii]
MFGEYPVCCSLHRMEKPVLYWEHETGEITYLPGSFLAYLSASCMEREKGVHSVEAYLLRCTWWGVNSPPWGASGSSEIAGLF